MQAKSKGIIFQSASLLLPIAIWMRKTPFLQGFDAIAVAAIRGYQRYLSPRKGFSCAHRRLHGGVSCSEYFRRSIEAEGLARAIPHFQRRLEACKQASFLLKVQRSEATTEEVDEEQTQKKKSDREAWANRVFNESSNCACDSIPEVTCNTIDCGISECNTPDCGSLDCGSLDCGSLDCGSLDCVGCACSW
jgi:putative component of membrane protein insertase Oxa1/YidC/SpoIIIJ protein YidD